MYNNLQLYLAKFISVFSLTVLLAGCTVSDQQRLHQAIHSSDPKQAVGEIVKEKAEQYAQTPDKIVNDIKILAKKFDDLEAIVRVLWGDKFGTLPGNKKYVKYTNDYQSKAEVDFAKGLVTVETIATKAPLEQLQKAIVITLLTGSNPANTDIFSDETPTISGKPYLYEQVLDHDKKPIAYQWRANRFAKYLIDKQLKTRQVGFRKSRYVQIPMVASHVDLRKQQYADHVLSAANRYQIRPDLIYAIIETESSFNPFAVSRANAYGLMQVVPATAGRDVYEKVLKKPGEPSKEVLFEAKDNIHIGTAYLHILQNNYLAKINDALSRHYAIISAYNGGAGNVFKTFSSDRKKAPAVINRLAANVVYRKLTKEHPRAESRRYLEKVTKAQQKY